MVREKEYNGIKIKVAEDYEEMSRLAADFIIQRIFSKQKLNLLLPAGSTPEGTYSILKKQPGRIFNKVRFFNMDEYCSDDKRFVSVNNPVSFRRYMKESLFKKIGTVKSYFPGIENIKQKGLYDKEIKRAGGIDLCINASGRDGHTFGFNFPGTKFNSITRIVKINNQTRNVNKKKTGYETPKYAVTTGLKTGMDSREVLFLASGKEKADIISKIVCAKKPTIRIPATILRLHPRCHWIIDEDAAYKL